MNVSRKSASDDHYPANQSYYNLDMSSERKGQGYTFYHQTGSQARLSNSCRTAERHLSRVEFQNAVVMSSVPLEEGRPFQVLIESKISTWSGSVIIGEK